MYVESYRIVSYRIYYIGWYLPTYYLHLVRIGRVEQTAGLLRGRQLPANGEEMLRNPAIGCVGLRDYVRLLMG